GHGGTATTTLSIAIAGTNDAPVITGDTSGAVKEDTAGQSDATGQLVAGDPDHGATQTWTVTGGTPSGSADYHFRMDSFTITKTPPTGTIVVLQDDFSDGNPPPSAPPLNPGQPNQQNTTYSVYGTVG